MSYMKDVNNVRLDTIAVAREPDLDSWPTYIYGNSYGVMSLPAGNFTLGNHYSEQVAARLGGGPVTTYAIPAKRILDVISALQNQAPYQALVTTPVAGSLWPGTSTRNGLVILESAVNDIGHYPSMFGLAVPAALPSANTRYLDSMTLQYRAALAMMSSQSRIEGSAYSGGSAGWTNTGTAYSSGGSIMFTTAVGSYLEYSVTPPQTGPLRGIVYIHGMTQDVSTGASAQRTISVDGTLQITRTPTAWEQYSGPANGNVNLATDCVAVTVPVDNAAHTIRITHAGSAGQYLWVDFISIPSTDPNPIAVMGGEHAVSYTGWTAGQIAAFHANAKAITPYLKNVTAEFPNAFYVPSTITPNGLFTDGLHPNDRGMAQRANDLQTAITSSIRARLESRRLANLPDASFGII